MHEQADSRIAPRASTLDRETVVAAAVRVARRVGVGGLTMRLLADELHASPMAAYRHVANRDALIELVADELLGAVPVPPRESGPWDQRLHQLERAAFRQLAGVAQSIELAMPPRGPHHQRLVDGVLDILDHAGFGPEDTTVAFEAIWAYVVGQLYLFEEGQSSPRRWPTLANVLAEQPDLSPEAYFDRGFELLLDGLRSRLAHTR
ncbi:MAG: TetR/AcrR family transcriptional regulator C-terminal domain-containing protein [Acidimicrobiaceae bacterium]|nr:TetR/AcrR family transcriptional regulator C-terminal domain-containing protein [Acidimicrobiaceae bacterium]